MIEAVVFDLDDTLYLEKEYVFSGFRAVSQFISESYGTDGTYDALETMFFDGVRGNTFDLLAEQLQLHHSQVDQMIEVYRGHEPELTLLPDAILAMNELRGYARIALITDGYLEVQKRKVEALGIANFFEKIVFSDELGRDCWKPSRAPYEEVMSALRLAGAQCCYVGDNPSKDFVTAKKLGWLTIRVRRREGLNWALEVSEEWEAHITTSSLNDLASTIRKWSLVNDGS